jgi:hypothetical protein
MAEPDQVGNCRAGLATMGTAEESGTKDSRCPRDNGQDG